MRLPNRTSLTFTTSSFLSLTSSISSVRMMPLINNNNCIKLLILSLVISFSSIVNSSSIFRKVPSPIYYREKGADLEIPCITEQKNVSCYWLKDGAIYEPQPGKYEFKQRNNGDCSLNIYRLDDRDNVEWTCQVFGAHQTPKEWPKTQVVVLVKPSEPKIDYDSLTSTPIAEKPTKISCRSSNGNPIPHLEWYLDDTNITQYATETVDGRTVVSLLNYTFKKKDNGSSLECHVVHRTGQQISKEVLNVQYKPYVSVKQKMYNVYEGNDLEIDCRVEANPEAKIYWKPTDKIDDSKYEIRENKLKLSNLDYTLDGKEFQCSAQNTVGTSESESVKLNVLYPPRLVEAIHPKKNITVGENIKFVCNFSGNPKPKIRWSFTDAIRRNLYYPEPSSDNPGELIIKNATYLNEGDYYCEGINYNSILNKENIVPSSKFTVNIVGRPLFINPRKVVNGYRGLDTKIEQTFCSDPQPDHVYWLYGSHREEVDLTVVNPTDEIFPDQHMDNNHIKTGRLIKIDSLSPNPTCFRVALMVTNTDTEDIRDYVLLVQNKYGKAEGIVTLRVNSPLSIAAVIAFALILLVIVLAITIGIILLRRRSSSSNNGKEQLDPEIEDKSEVQVPKNDSYDIAVQKKKNGH